MTLHGAFSRALDGSTYAVGTPLPGALFIQMESRPFRKCVLCARLAHMIRNNSMRDPLIFYKLRNAT